MGGRREGEERGGRREPGEEVKGAGSERQGQGLSAAPLWVLSWLVKSPPGPWCCCCAALGSSWYFYSSMSNFVFEIKPCFPGEF